MMFDYETLKVIWWVLVGILLIGFAILDGKDLGVNILLPLLGKNDAERRVIINSVGPHWEGNQVWLITAGGAIFAAWPLVYAAAFSGLYMGLLLVLFGLFFRPVGYDYRDKVADPRWRSAWDWAIFVSGFVPCLVFGVAFGNLLQGLPFHYDTMFMPHYEKHFIFALLGLLNPFALLSGVISLLMLTVQAALWIQIRCDMIIAARARRVTAFLAPVVIVAFAGAGIWIAYGIEGFRIVGEQVTNVGPNPLAKTVEHAVGAWLDIYSRYPIAMLVPVLGLTGVFAAWMFSQLRRPGLAFLANSLGMAGIIGTAGISMFPFVMPSSTVPNSGLTLWDSTSSHLTLMIMLWVVIFMLPIVLSYTIWAYVRMWGRITTATIEADSHTLY